MVIVVYAELKRKLEKKIVKRIEVSKTTTEAQNASEKKFKAFLVLPFNE